MAKQSGGRKPPTKAQLKTRAKAAKARRAATKAAAIPRDPEPVAHPDDRPDAPVIVTPPLTEPDEVMGFDETPMTPAELIAGIEEKKRAQFEEDAMQAARLGDDPVSTGGVAVEGGPSMDLANLVENLPGPTDAEIHARLAEMTAQRKAERVAPLLDLNTASIDQLIAALSARGVNVLSTGNVDMDGRPILPDIGHGRPVRKLEGGGTVAILKPGDPTFDNPERTFWKDTRTKAGTMKSYTLRWFSPRSGNLITKNVTERVDSSPQMSR